MAPLISRAGQASTAQSFFILSWILCGIASLLLGGRCYTCWKLLHRAQADLYLAICTFCIGVASMLTLTLGAINGLGQHTSDLDPRQGRGQFAIENGWITLALGLVAIGVGKIAITAFILRLRGFHEPWSAACLWTIGSSSLVVNIIEVVLFFTQCRPNQKLWDPGGVQGTCPLRVLVTQFGIFQTAWSAFCDITLALYPAILLWNVHALSVAKRVGISMLLGLSVIAAICASIKAPRIPLVLDLSDSTYEMAEVIIWNETEMWIVLIVGCIPPTMPLFRVFVREGSAFYSVLYHYTKSSVTANRAS